MAKKTYRTQEQQEYRDNLAKKLRNFRAQWDDWKEVAEALLETLKTSEEYKNAKEWTTKEAEVDKLLSYLHSISEASWRISEDVVHSKLEELADFLETNNNLTENQYSILKKMLNGNCRFDDKLWPKLWENIFDRFSQKDKEDVFFDKTVISEFKLPTLEKTIQASENKEFIYFMLQLLIYEWWISKISPETEKKFLDTIFTNHSYKVRILEMLVDWFKNRNNHRLVSSGFVSDEERFKNIPPKIKESLVMELKDENLLNSLVEKLDCWSKCDNFVVMLKSFGVIIPRYIAKKITWDPSVDKDKLREIIDVESVKTALNNMFETQDLTYIEKLVCDIKYPYYWKLWPYVDAKYKTPKYLNPHMEDISQYFWLSDKNRISLLRKLKENPKSWEKYNVHVILDYPLGYILIRNANDKLIDLIVDTVELDENSDSRLLYSMMKKKWEVDENIMFNIIKNIWKMISFKEEDNFKKALMQEIYGTKNKRLIVELFKQFKAFDKCCTEEEKDILIRQFVHVMSDEDVDIFKSIMKQYSDRKIHSDLLFKIRYFLGDIKNLSYYDALPKDVYVDAIKRKIIWLNDSLPQVIHTSYIDPDDFSKLLSLLKADEDRIQRLKEEEEKFIKSVKENREKWEVIFNFTKQEQKFVLSVDREKWCLRFLTEDLPYHSNIHSKYVKDGRCVWWWRIQINEQLKTIMLHWYSESYWSVPDEYKDAMKKMLEKQYPGYEIIL